MQPLAPVCKLCQTQKPKDVDDRNSMWSCKFCTLDNSLKLDHCTACGEWRYSHGPPVATPAPNLGTWREHELWELTFFSGNSHSSLLMSILRCLSVDQVHKNSPNLINWKSFLSLLIVLRWQFTCESPTEACLYPCFPLNFLYVNFFLSRNIVFTFGNKENQYSSNMFLLFLVELNLSWKM